jgi:hypothetical protein
MVRKPKGTALVAIRFVPENRDLAGRAERAAE